MINTELTNPEIYYSPYGYIEVNKNDYMDPDKEIISFVRKRNYLHGTIRKNQLSNHIIVHYKTFHGDRRTYSFEVCINEKLCDIIAKICIEEDKLKCEKRWNYASQYRLYSSVGFVRELNPLNSYKDEEIKNNQTILMLSPIGLNFSENKGNLIYLESRNKVAYKQGGDEHQLVLTEQGYNSGKHYCEVILETEPYERSVIVGVSTARTEFHLNPAEVKGFYGYILSECKKVSQVSSKVELVDYGDITKIGDRIGIMLEFTDLGLELSFYVNKINMGVAFKSLPVGGVETGVINYFPAVALGFDGTRVKITNKVGFPDV